MRKLLSILSSLALLCATSSPVQAARRNFIITITAGTPIQVSSTPLLANRILIQMIHGGSGIGYVCISASTPAAACGTAGQLAGELAPASSTAPGGSYSDTTAPDAGGPLDLSQYYIDGSNSGDKCLISVDLRN